MIGYIRTLLFGSNGPKEIGGTGAVFEAITERTDMGYDVQITLDEPKLIDRGNITEDLYVHIPTYTVSGPDPANLEYPLPNGIEDAEAELYTILNAFGIEKIADIDQLAGKVVPGKMSNGSPVPLFDELRSTETTSE